MDFIEVKTGAAAGLTREEREIKGLIEEGKVRFILKREEVEITTPEEMKELTDGFAKGDADVKTRKVKEEETKGEIYETTEELKPENQNHVRDFVNASEIYEKMETKTYDNELFEKLRKLRTGIAREENVEPFFIFHNSVLKEIAIKKPTTKEELLLIKGIGDKKIEKYGEKVLNVIRAHLSERR